MKNLVLLAMFGLMALTLASCEQPAEEFAWDDDLFVGPAEEIGDVVELYRLLYGFCDHEFYEVAMFAEGRYRADLEAIFTDQLGEPTSREDDVVYWDRDNVSARVRTAPQFFEKVEGRLTYTPIEGRCRRYAEHLKMVWPEPDAGN